MSRVGVRELRERPRDLIRRVLRGETLEITDRGVPVALLSPICGGALDRLRAAGEVEPASIDLDEIGEPLPPRSGTELPSVVLVGLRGADR